MPVKSFILESVISGGQTGVDQAALRAASDLNIKTGGTMPKEYMTELGPHRKFSWLYGMAESHSSAYLVRTIQNVQDADMTLLIGRMAGGTKTTGELCLRLKKPAFFVARESLLVAGTSEKTAKRIIAERRRQDKPLILNVAGTRESKTLGIGAETENFLTLLFVKLLHVTQ